MAKKRARSAKPLGAQPTGVPDAKWTVMIFMGAASVGGEPLLEAAEDDIRELEFVGSGPIVPDGQRKSVGELNIFVQEHGRSPAPRRSHVRSPKAEFEPVPGASAEPAGGHAIGEFIKWSLERAKHDPLNPQHYSVLVLWGHSYGFAFGRERTRTGDIDSLDFAELAGILERIRQGLGYDDAKLDIIAFDACDAATIEMACQLEPFAKFLLASEIGIPIPGWPYDRILGRLRKPYGRLMGVPEFGTWAVRRFCEAYSPTEPASLTLLDLQRAQPLREHADYLALALSRLIRSADARRLLAEVFSRSQTDDDRPYVDVADLCLSLTRETDDLFVAQAAGALGNFLLGPRPPLVGVSEAGSGNRFIVEHGRNSNVTARLNGVSLYAPHLAPDQDFEAAHSLYLNFGFARETRWSEVVHALARLA